VRVRRERCTAVLALSRMSPQPVVVDRAGRRHAPVLAYWDDLIDQWLGTTDMPLFIRKSALRFEMHRQPAGREIIFVDNSPAHWCMSCALDGTQPTLDEVRTELQRGKLPVVYAIRNTMKKIARPSTSRGTQSQMSATNLNERGYKVCHIQPVGMNTAAAVESIALDDLARYTRRLLNTAAHFPWPPQESPGGQSSQMMFFHLELPSAGEEMGL